MARDERTDSGQYYPGGKVVPHQPVRPGGGSDANAVHYYAETKTAAEKAQARANIGAMPSDAPIPSVDGKLPMRPLPKYLHALSFDDTYPADAAWLYAQLGPSDLGRCSAVRRGGKLWRNYDWTFDDAAEFVVRMSGNATRFGSVGVASVGSRLTENDVMSAVNSRYYKCLPGMTLDGINEKGVVCEINVDGGPKTGWHGDAADDGIHILAAVRWVLDHGETAAQAAEWIADHIIAPTGDMNFHFMVADATSTYIVENGKYALVDDGEVPVLTNFEVLMPNEGEPTTYSPEAMWELNRGPGIERLRLLTNGSPIVDARFTNAYKSGNDWDSDFESAAQHAAAISQWAEQGTDKEAHRGKTTSSGKAWWQSVHTTEYDFAAKTMKVAVQEVDDWYTFSVGQANVDLAPIEEQLASHSSQLSQLSQSKRDKSDLYTLWVPDYEEIDGQPNYDGIYWYWDTSRGRFEAQVSDIALEAEFFNLDPTASYPSFTATRSKLATTSDLASKLDADDPVLTATAPSTNASATALAGAKATGDALEKKADEFTEWEFSEPEYYRNGWIEQVDDDYWFFHYQVLEGSEWFDSLREVASTTPPLVVNDLAFSGIATRKRVLRTGDAATPQEVAAKFDTSKAVPAYSASLTYDVGEIVLHDGAAYKCVTAITTAEAWTAAHWTAATDADLAARLKGLKADGEPTDTFATDLLGKPVANIKANTTALAPAFSDESTYAVGDTVTHEGNLYTCKTAISTAGAWNSSKWNLTPVNALIDAKVGDIDDALDELNGEVA